jgi:hypothetical protein
MASQTTQYPYLDRLRELRGVEQAGPFAVVEVHHASANGCSRLLTAATREDALALAEELRPLCRHYYRHGRRRSPDVVAVEAREAGWVQVDSEAPWVYRAWGQTHHCLAAVGSRAQAEAVLASEAPVAQWQVEGRP